MRINLTLTRDRNWFAVLVLLVVSGPVASIDQIDRTARTGRIEGALGMFGRSLDIERITSHQTAEQAAKETAKRWRHDAHPSVHEDPRSGKVLELVRPPWWIVSRSHGEWLETVQWKDQGISGAEGVRSRMAVPIPGGLAMPMPMSMTPLMLMPMAGAGAGAGAGAASKPEVNGVPVPKLRPASRLSLRFLAEAQTHDRVSTQIYRSELQPAVLYPRWLSALLAEGFASDAREPACIKLVSSPTSGCSGLHRSRLDELVWTIAPEGEGSALVVHLLSRSEAFRSEPSRAE